jgi:hypothetical protein
VEEYNQYDEINLFIDQPWKMRIIETSIRIDDKLWHARMENRELLPLKYAASKLFLDSCNLS